MSLAIGNNVVTFSDNSTMSSGWTGYKNRIINGAMMIDQRNNGSSTTTVNGYHLDRWMTGSIGGATFTIQQVTDAPAGFYKSYKMTVSTSSTSADYNDIRQRIEGNNVADLNWGESNGSPITVSFWVKANTTGTYSGRVTYYGPTTYYYHFEYTINSSNTWQKITVSISAPPTSAGAFSNSLNTSYMELNVLIMQTSSYTNSVTPNVWSSTGGYRTTNNSVYFPSVSGATFQFTGVQLEKGSVASSYEYRPYGTEAHLCYRYFYKLGGLGNNQAIYFNGGTLPSSSSGCPVIINCPAVFRTSPDFSTNLADANYNTGTLSGSQWHFGQMSNGTVSKSGTGFGIFGQTCFLL